eukprot:COSAG01_NODE_69328_length_261_cov_1.592593_1_plen_83_part_10
MRTLQHTLAAAKAAADGTLEQSGAAALVVGYPEEEGVPYAVPEEVHGAATVVSWEEKQADALPNAVAEAQYISGLLGCAALTG